MAVTFGKDGTIYCNTVRYNYKQTRNLVADNGYTYGHWDIGACSIVKSQRDGAFSNYQLKFPVGEGLYMSTQPMPTPIANHIYYGGLLWKTGSNFSAGDGRFEWYHTDGDTNVNLTFVQKVFYSTNNNWIKLSGIVQAGSSPNSGQWIIRNFIVNGTTDSYCAKPIIIDLTECFGAGNEPTKEWCDDNLLEWNKLVGFNSFNFIESDVSSSMTFTGMTYGATYNITNGNQYFINRTDIPRSYCIDMQSGTSNSCYIFLGKKTQAVNDQTYYTFVDLSQPNGNYGKSYEWYFPFLPSSYLFGTVPQVENGHFNSGGGLYNWKRISFYNIRQNITEGDYNSKFQFNNGGSQLYLALTNFFMANALILLQRYRDNFGLSANFSDTNKEFYDRWVGGDCDCVIHIKNHLDKSIKFNTTYDIVCNDIETHPSINTIIMDKNGTIKCKKLVRTQAY